MFKVVILRGGLGNQMFEYAFSRYIKDKYKLSFLFLDETYTDVNHNGYELPIVFPRIAQKTSKFNRRVRKLHKDYFTKTLFNIILEESKDFGNFQIRYLKYRYLFAVYDGYWQSEKYFKSVEDKVRKKFTFNLDKLNRKSKQHLLNIIHKNSVSIHIRRGDYLNHNENFGNICTTEYYIKAIDYLNAIELNLYFYIFTDDVNWVRNNFKINNSEVIGCNRGADNWQDMCLMSYCKHNIIANSTFSWWGAWLNSNSNKIVFAPLKWMNNEDCKEIIPSDWIRL